MQAAPIELPTMFDIPMTATQYQNLSVNLPKAIPSATFTDANHASVNDQGFYWGWSYFTDGPNGGDLIVVVLSVPDTYSQISQAQLVEAYEVELNGFAAAAPQ